MSFRRAFFGIAVLVAFPVATLVLLSPASVTGVRAQAAQAATPTQQTTGAGAAAATGQADPARQKSLASMTIEKVREVAKSAGDIFSRVPCLPPKGGVQSLGSLPHVAGKLASGAPVMIVAFGSSSTQGWGSTSPEFTYPNRLAAQLHRQYPSDDITVINRGKGGDDAPEMISGCREK